MMTNVNGKTILVIKQDGILNIQFNRPEKKNAITLEMYQVLNQSIQHAEDSEDIKAIVIQGSHQIFTSGNDITDFLTQPSLTQEHPAAIFLHLLANCKKPIVASINGLAIGIGTTLLLHCDLIYATPQSTFQLPFIHLGLTPEAGASFLLPRLVGYPKAAELLLLGETFTAETALQYGMINDIIPENDLETVVSNQVKKLTAKPLKTILATKSLLKKSFIKKVNTTIGEELQLFTKSLQSVESKTAFKAFLSKQTSAI